MNDEKHFKKIPELNYCIICRKFYTNSCDCLQTLIDTNKNQEISLESNGYSLINKFFCLILIIYNYTSKLLKAKQVIEYKQQIKPKKITLKGFRDIETKQNLFSKYIYLCNDNGHGFNPNCSFYVYMMSVHVEEENQQMRLLNNPNDTSTSASNNQSPETTPRNENFTNTSTSTSSLGSKKSGTGSVLSRISKTLKRKHKNEVKKSPENGNSSLSSASKETTIQKYQSKSKIPIPKSRMRINQKSNISLNPSQKTQSFFRKFMPKSASFKTGLDTKPTKSNSVMVETNERKCHSSTNIRPEKKFSDIKITPQLSEFCIRTRSSSKAFIPESSPFLGCTNLNLDLTTFDGLREAIELSQKLQDSETHLTHIISKYIQDHSFEKELLNVLTSHAKLHLEAERRAQSLAHEMWLQQSEVMKTQEQTLKENLNAVIKQNRQLQEEIESLVKKNEQIWAIKLRQFPEFMRQPGSDSSSMLIENLSKNNNKLRDKLCNMTEQIEEQDREMHILQRKTQLLEQQLRSSNSQVHSFK
ncbi:hypothetical protein ILUMI_16702, partial [Ignelater luminosus]